MKSALILFTLFASAGLFSTSCSTTRPLEGKWSCVAATIDGKPLPESTATRLVLTLTGNRYKTERGSEVLFDSTYSIDQGQHPKHITMIGTEGDLAGKEARGIYTIQGDTLRISYTMPGGVRPSVFESSVGSGVYSITWKRQTH